MSLNPISINQIEEDIVEEAELNSDGTSSFFSGVTIVSTSNATNRVTFSGVTLSQERIDAGDILTIAGSTAADGDYIVTQLITELILEVVGPIPNSTGGTGDFKHPPAAGRVGVDSTNLERTIATKLDVLLADFDNQILPRLRRATPVVDPASIPVATVDDFPSISITLTSGVTSLTLPPPTDTANSRLFAILHAATSSGTLEIDGIQVATKAVITFIWNVASATWLAIGGSSGGGVPPAPASIITIIDDFISPLSSSALGWQDNTQGGGSGTTVIAGEVNHPGIHQLSSGASGTGRAAKNLGPTALALGGGETLFDWVVKVPILATAGIDYFVQLGYGDEFTLLDQTDGVYFEYNRAVSLFWQCATSSGGTRTKINSAITVVADTWYKLTAIIDVPANTVTWRINDVEEGTIMTNIPSGVGFELGPFAKIVKLGGNGDRTLSVDLFRFQQVLTVPR